MECGKILQDKEDRLKGNYEMWKTLQNRGCKRRNDAGDEARDLQQPRRKGVQGFHLL